MIFEKMEFLVREGLLLLPSVLGMFYVLTIISKIGIWAHLKGSHFMAKQSEICKDQVICSLSVLGECCLGNSGAHLLCLGAWWFIMRERSGNKDQSSSHSSVVRAARPSVQPELHPWNPCVGRRETTPSCQLSLDAV